MLKFSCPGNGSVLITRATLAAYARWTYPRYFASLDAVRK